MKSETPLMNKMRSTLEVIYRTRAMCSRAESVHLMLRWADLTEWPRLQPVLLMIGFTTALQMYNWIDMHEGYRFPPSLIIHADLFSDFICFLPSLSFLVSYAWKCSRGAFLVYSTIQPTGFASSCEITIFERMDTTRECLHTNQHILASILDDTKCTWPLCFMIRVFLSSTRQYTSSDMQGSNWPLAYKNLLPSPEFSNFLSIPFWNS